MKFEVDGWNNFCRIFELPKEFSSDFCFNGGIDTNFKMVDWFNPVSGIGQPGITKEMWIKEVGEIEPKTVFIEELKENLIPFLLEKKYIKESRKYVVICDFGACFIFSKKGENNE